MIVRLDCVPEYSVQSQMKHPMIHDDIESDSIEGTYFLDKKRMLLFTVVEHHYVNFIVLPSFINNSNRKPESGNTQPIADIVKQEYFVFSFHFCNV